MRELIFCSRCRGMEVGWNRTWVRHRITCRRPSFSPRFLRLPGMVVLALLAAIFIPNGAVAPATPDAGADASLVLELAEAPLLVEVDPAVAAVEDLLGRYTSVKSGDRLRIARAVVRSARAQDVDPFLVTGVLIAESSGNPYAISNRQAVGIMQIHVPTWGETAEAEGLNLFLLEDNIELGTRILKDYTRRYGRWDGVMRYLGARDATPEALAYVQRVQGIFSDRQAD